MLLIIFIGAVLLSGTIFHLLTNRIAQEDMSYQGEFILEVMNSVRHYTNKEISPLLQSGLETEEAFISQSVPAYSARKVFEALTEKPEYRDYIYKEAVENPTSPVDQADEFELDLIAAFRKQPDTELLTGFRTILGQQEFYKAKPIIVKDESCLRCHGLPEDAPKSMIATYGSENGFGWPMNEPIGVQIVSVPSTRVFDIATQALLLVMFILGGVFAFIVLMVHFLLKWSVMRPMTPLVRLAQRITTDQMKASSQDEADLENLRKFAHNPDEMGQLARIFVQMADAVFNRERSFTQQLQRLRDRSTYQQEKENDLNYFRSLQRRAQAIRETSEDSGD